jgi:mannose-6-phosphate isomerase-like protein (cupin superfamily)
MSEVYSVNKVNIAEKFNMFEEYWSPRIIGELNDSYVKAAKLKGTFDWHTHKDEDELFLVIKGCLVIKLRNEDIHLKEGEFFIVPKGIEHLPIAEEEAHVLFIEPKSTLNTGNVLNEKTKQQLPKI